MTSLIHKVLIWRLVSVIAMVATLWVLTGDIIESTSVTIIVQIVQTIVHAMFESWWANRANDAN